MSWEDSLYQLIFLQILPILLNQLLCQLHRCQPHCLNVSTTPITAMGCQQCLPIGVVQLKGKHCWKPHCHNGVVDTFGQYLLVYGQIETISSHQILRPDFEIDISNITNVHKVWILILDLKHYWQSVPYYVRIGWKSIWSNNKWTESWNRSC